MKKIIKTESVAVLAMAVILICLFFVPPQAGVADNGDFERVMSATGMKSFSMPFADQFYDYANFTYEKQPIFLWGSGFYATTHILPIRIARLFQWGSIFDTRVLAVVYSLLFLLGMFLIIRNTKQKSWIANSLLAVLAVFVLCDSTQTVYFNSFYGEAASYCGLLLMLGCALILVNGKVNGKTLLAFFLSAFLFFGSKLQYTLLSIFMILFLLPLFLAYPKYRRQIVAGLLTVVLITGAIYFIAPPQLGKDTQYNSVFYGILKDSPDVAGDLKSLGLPAEYAVLAGTNAYTPNPPIDVKSLQFEQNFYEAVGRGTVIRFYLTHPARFIEKLQLTTQNAFDNTLGMMGNFQKKDGMEPHRLNHFFTAYNTVRKTVFPNDFWFLFGYYLLYFILLVFLFIKKKNTRQGVALLGFIMLLGIAQFPLPILGNGEADIAKQLFIFNVTFDISLLAAVWGLIRLILKWRANTKLHRQLKEEAG